MDSFDGFDENELAQAIENSLREQELIVDDLLYPDHRNHSIDYLPRTLSGGMGNSSSSQPTFRTTTLMTGPNPYVFGLNETLHEGNFRELPLDYGSSGSIPSSHFGRISIGYKRLYEARSEYMSYRKVNTPEFNLFASFGIISFTEAHGNPYVGNTVRFTEKSPVNFCLWNYTMRTRHFKYSSKRGAMELTLPPMSRLQFLTREFSLFELGQPLTKTYDIKYGHPGLMFDLPEGGNTMHPVRGQPDAGMDEIVIVDPFGHYAPINVAHPLLPLVESGGWSLKDVINSIPYGDRRVIVNATRVFLLTAMISIVMGLCGPSEVERCGTCLLPALSPCSAGYQCDSGACTLGLCMVGMAACPPRPMCLNRFCDDSANTCCTSASNCPGDHTCLRAPGSLSGICKKNDRGSCSDDSDCASGNCPVGGGICVGTNTQGTVSYCCDSNGYASQCPSPSPTPSPSQSSTSTASGTPSSSKTPSPSSFPSPPQISMSPTITLVAINPTPTVLGTPPVTPTPSNMPLSTPEPSASCDHCHMQTRNLPYDADNISAGGRLEPSFPFSLFIKGADAVPCKNGRYYLNLAHTQKVGSTIQSNCSYEGCPIQYDPVISAGILEPSFQDYQDCPPPPKPEISVRRAPRTVLAFDEVVTVDLTDNLFTITFSGGDYPRVIALQLNGATTTLSCTTSVCFIVADPQALFKSGKAVFTAIKDGEVVATKVLEYTGQYPCFVKDCWTCNLTNWSCVPKIFKALMVVMVIAICIFVLWVLIKMAIISVGCLGLLSSGLFVCLKGITQIGRNKVHAMRLWFDAARVPIVISMMVLGISACDNSLVITDSLVSCEYSGVSEYCTISTNEIISLSGPGASSCLIFSKDGTVFAQLEVSMSTNQITCNLADHYFTSSYKVHSASVFHCQGGLGSNCTSDCSSQDLRTQSTYFNRTTDYLDYPGLTTCNRQCSGVGCGCLLPTLGCVYTTFSYIPEGTSMRVSRYINCQNTPIITYKLTDSSGAVTSGSFSYEGGASSDQNFEMRIVSAMDRVPPADLPSHICDSGKVFFCDASYVNSPLPGKNGDIQSLNITGLNNGQFIVSDEIFLSYNHQNKYNKVVTRTPGYNTNGKALPSLNSGLVWSVDSSGSGYPSKIFAYDDRPSPTLISISSNSNLTVSRTVTKVCPTTKFLNVTGCYSCSAGFEACFEAKSTCFEGTVILESESISQQIVFLTRQNRDFCVQGFTNESSVSETVSLGEDTFRMKGDLQEGIQLGQETILFSGEEVPAHVSFRKGNWKWWEYLLASIIMLLAFLSLIALLALIFPVLWTFLKGLSVVKKIFRRESKAKKDPEIPTRTEYNPKNDPVFISRSGRVVQRR